MAMVGGLSARLRVALCRGRGARAIASSAERLVLVGRPNVGKSTLFNRLCRGDFGEDLQQHRERRRRSRRGRWSGERRQAIVSAVPGTTRDYREGSVDIGGTQCVVVDTGGLDIELPEVRRGKTAHGDAVDAGAIAAQTRRALAGSCLVLFVADAGAGITALDRHFADWLRKTFRGVRDDGAAPFVACILNKSDAVSSSNRGTERAPACLHTTVEDCRKLGFGSPLLTSAIHGHGMADVYQLVASRLQSAGDDSQAPPHAGGGGEAGQSARRVDPSTRERVRIAIVGRPNTGKSTIFNRLVGRTRSIAGPTPGLTRDAVLAAWPVRGADDTGGEQRAPAQGTGSDDGALHMELVDTAGMRRKRAKHSDVELQAVSDATAAVAFAHVVAVVVDGPLMRQDLTIIGKVVSEGRAVVLLANKVDIFLAAAAEESPSVVSDFVREQLQSAGLDVYRTAVLPISAATGLGVNAIRAEVEAVYHRWNKKIAAKALNAWLQAFSQSNSPPKGLALLSMSQIKIRPPTFKVIFTSKDRSSMKMPVSFTRRFARALHESFGFGGVPLRINYSLRTDRRRTR